MQRFQRIATLIFAFFIFFANSVFADQVQDPVQQLKHMLSQIEKDVSGKQSDLQSNPEQIYQIVQKDLMPYMAMDRLSGMALGPKWSHASKAQRDAFVRQFSRMLTRAYTGALLKVTEYHIVINPLRDNAWKTATQLSVSGNVVPKSGGEPTAVTYYLVRQGNAWLIYDFAVQGISIMRNFQTQFQGFADIAAVIARIQEVNEEDGN